MSNNIYGKQKFKANQASTHVKDLINLFKDYYSNLGYSEVNQVSITSGVDPTVRFIGSHISVLKSFLEKNEVPFPGVYIHQNCIRTKNVTRLLDDDFYPMWGSYFPSIGVLVPSQRLEASSNESLDFFTKVLDIPIDNFLIRISSSDNDLINVAKKVFGESKLEIDSREQNYYRHKLGMPGIWGRNFNIALKKQDGDYSDVGNIILIENKSEQLGVEIALGVSTILKELYSLDHVQDCTPVEGIITNDQALKRKVEDTIIVCSVLFSEGLRPSEQHNRNRILKGYIRALSYFRAILMIKHDQLEMLIKDFIDSQLNISSDISTEIVQSVINYETTLKDKQNLAKDDAKVIEALKLFS